MKTEIKELFSQNRKDWFGSESRLIKRILNLISRKIFDCEESIGVIIDTHARRKNGITAEDLSKDIIQLIQNKIKESK